MYYLYRVSNKEIVKISMYLPVDQYFWQLKGKNIALIQQSHSYSYLEQLRKKQRLISQPISQPDSFYQEAINAEKWEEWERQAQFIHSILQGRSLMDKEIESYLSYHGFRFSSKRIRMLLQLLSLKEQLHIIPCVENKPWAIEAICHRCQADSSYIYSVHCQGCERPCVYCTHCVNLDRSQSCRPLFQFPIQSAFSAVPSSPPKLQLTPPQQKVHRFIEDFYQSSDKELLIHAVTGAGKTEMLAYSIYHILQLGGRVLWCTPRKDVVHELTPRFKKMFPEQPVIALYGGSPDRWKIGNLILSTSHQVIRFSHCFDLVVVDEADAFPLHGNQALHQSILRSVKKKGKRILLTATPPPDWMEQRQRKVIQVPIRYHQKLHPVPKLYRMSGLWKRISKGKSIQHVSYFLQKVMQTEGQALIFVPRVGDVENVFDWLQKCHPDWQSRIAQAHGRDPDRQTKIQQFREGRFQILVTTTILERGVTFPRCHVFVLGAEHPVFQCSALVQIAGRVGRSPTYQKGEIWFLATENTLAQRAALQEIKRLNRMAIRKQFP